ncbi:hypothetical protein DQ04_04921000 [Trypanosoma grayi]|uniref:hypothetical protein n=1 Tax=Trypanosoma grayi TaxID=71804 RepID=UPI0004F40481|nr:hypothetical protein DQ04_04921000 [Trypanosoma grayi]KEG09625.1 hypothetical protein DQ04_04921000 [Trypanosoma grayi]
MSTKSSLAQEEPKDDVSCSQAPLAPASPALDELLGRSDLSEASRVSVWGSPCVSGSALPADNFQRASPNTGDAPLCAAALSRMAKDAATGDMSLRADFLDKNALPLVKLNKGHRNLSMITIMPETEDSNCGSPLRPETEVAPVINTAMRVRGSRVSTSMASAESVCGDSVAQGHLSACNLDGLSFQLLSGNVRSTSDALAGHCVQRTDGVVSESVAEDAGTSVRVEVGSDTRCRVMSQSESAFAVDDSRNGIAGDTVSDVSSLHVPLCNFLPLNKENLEELRLQIASGQCPLREEVLMGLNAAMLPKPDASQSMLVEPPAAVSRLGDAGMPQEETLSNGLPKAPSCCEDAPNADVWEGEMNALRRLVENVVADMQRETSERASIIADMVGLRHLLQVHTKEEAKVLQASEEKRCAFQTIVETNLARIETQMMEADAQISVGLSTEMDVLKQMVNEEMQSLRTHYEGQLSAVLQEVNDRLGKADQLMKSVLERQKELQQQVDYAFRLEALPPGEAIPDGEKIRLVIDLHIFDEHQEVLLPISSKATVGICKRELLRRIRHQGLIDDDIRYSNVVLLHGNVALYEEDVLSDIFTSEVQNAGNGGCCLKLTLRTTHTRRSGSSVTMQKDTFGSTPSATVEPGASSLGTGASASDADPAQASSSATKTVFSSSLPHVNILPICIPTTEKPPQSEDFGVLRANIVDDLSQNESLDRRLVWELERIEFDAIKRDEQSRHIVVAKDALNRIRATLLDRVMYSSVEAHRRLARSALEKLDRALLPGSTVEEMGLASSTAAATLQSISSTEGEDERVTAMQEDMRVEEERKQKLVEDIKVLNDEISNRLRIPANLMRRAESVTQSAQRAIILAPTMSQKDLDAVHEALVDYCAAVRTQN